MKENKAGEQEILYTCEPELPRSACFVSGCANSRGDKEVRSFLPMLGMQCQDTREVTVSNSSFLLERLTQQAKQATLLEEKIK